MLSCNIYIGPKLIPVRRRMSLAPSPRTRSHLTPVRIHQGTNPLICHRPALHLAIPSQIRCRAEVRGLEVDVNSLPLAPIGLIDLMHEANVVVLFDRLLPPLPGLPVLRPMCVPVHVLDATPVADEDQLGGLIGVSTRVARLAED